jgi:hypothetical protein
LASGFGSVLFPRVSHRGRPRERLLLVLLALVTVFATIALLIRSSRRTLWRAIPHKLEAGTYFAALGLDSCSSR